MTETELTELKRKADAENMTMSNYVRDALAKLKIINIVKGQ